MSAPASPGRAYAGSGSSVSRRRTSTRTVGASALAGTAPASWSGEGSVVTAPNATLDAMDASSETPPPGASAGPRPIAYRESLRTPWLWYAGGLFVAGLLAAEFHIAGLRLTY